MSGGTGTGTKIPYGGGGTGQSTTPGFAQQLIDDLAVFFDPIGGFAVTAVYTPDGGVARNINVIFDKESIPEMGMDARRFYCEAKTTDVIAVKPGETIMIAGVTYKIKDPPHHTSDGTSEIELSID